VPELRAAAGCGCRLPPCTSQRRRLLHKRSPSGLVCSAGHVPELRDAAGCGCRLPPCYQPAKALAALTKPFRAGVQCRGKCRSFELQLAADAGLLHLARLSVDAGCRHAPASEGTCCTNEALQGWCAVQRHVPELRDAAQACCTWRSWVANTDFCECSGVWRCGMLRKWSPQGGVQRLAEKSG